MKTAVKTEPWCEEHFAERLKILLDRKEQYIIDIVNSGAIVAFSAIESSNQTENCKAPKCKEKATRLYMRTDFYPDEVDIVQ